MMSRAKQVAALPQLPREVVQQIFSTTMWSSVNVPAKLALELKDRVRALAVCRSWNAYLDPKLWPIEELVLEGSEEADRRTAIWIITTQPAVRHLSLTNFQPALHFMTLSAIAVRTALAQLSLSGEAALMLDSVPAVCLFTRLRVLSLSVEPALDGQLDLAALQPLSALEHLECGAWELVKMTAGTVLPQLKSVEFWDLNMLEIDAALPSLQRLDVSDVESFRLEGEHLQLPQLSQLSLTFASVVDVDWPAVPQLAELSLDACMEVSTTGLAGLGHLTSLTLDWSRASRHVGQSVLQAAPQCLCHIRFLNGSYYGSKLANWSPVPGLERFSHLISVSSRSLAIIADLGPLVRLQHVVFPHHSVTDLTLEHLDSLSRQTTLQRLEFGISVLESDAGDRIEGQPFLANSWHGALPVPQEAAWEEIEACHKEGVAHPLHLGAARAIAKLCSGKDSAAVVVLTSKEAKTSPFDLCCDPCALALGAALSLPDVPHAALLSPRTGMSHQSKGKQSAIAPDLPEEVVRYIFTLKTSGSYPDNPEPVLSLKDRVRALAVCQAWKAYLNPRLFPIGELDLHPGPLAAWVASTQPALQSLSLSDFQTVELHRTLLSVAPRMGLTALCLAVKAGVLLESLPALCLFPRLKKLKLHHRGDDQSRLDLAALQPLSALEDVKCLSWRHVELKGGTMLIQLTSLAVLWSTRSITIDAALPSLQELKLECVDALQLAGEHLRLPQLTQLKLACVDNAAIDWQALHQLVNLSVDTANSDVVIPALPSLGCLNSLTLSCHAYSQREFVRLLQAAPPSLRQLSLGPKIDWSRPPPFHLVPQLTSLACGPNVLQHLGPLTQLQRLELCESADSVTPTHMGWLGGLTTLEEVHFRYKQSTKGSAAWRRIQELKNVLPAGCKLTHPFQW